MGILQTSENALFHSTVTAVINAPIEKIGFLNQ